MLKSFYILMVNDVRIGGWMDEKDLQTIKEVDTVRDDISFTIKAQSIYITFTPSDIEEMVIEETGSGPILVVDGEI